MLIISHQFSCVHYCSSHELRVQVYTYVNFKKFSMFTATDTDLLLGLQWKYATTEYSSPWFEFIQWQFAALFHIFFVFYKVLSISHVNYSLWCAHVVRGPHAFVN